MARFVFVHGAFQGGWVWKLVSDLLQEKGHEIHTPTLSGCGYLSHGLREGFDLNTYIDDIVDYIRTEDLKDVVLVAQSYSGMICGAVIAQVSELLRRAIFLDAVIPEQGRSFVDIAGAPFDQMLGKHRDGFKINPWPLPVFGVEGDKAPWFQQRLCPFPEAAFRTPLPVAFDPNATEVSFITCTKTMAPFIRAQAETARSLRWPIREFDEGHCSMVMNPQLVADTFHEVVSI